MAESSASREKSPAAPGRGAGGGAAVEIPFYVHRDKPPKWVSGIGPATTCADVLMSLASAVRNSDGEAIFSRRDVSLNRLFLVEEWRGVVKPLHPDSKIMKLWQAWGEERTQVQFIIKRAKNTESSSSRAPALLDRANEGGSVTSPVKRRRKLRRRNSGSSVGSAANECHPRRHYRQLNEFEDRGGGGDADVDRQIQDLMSVIVTQGRAICDQLQRLNESRSLDTSIQSSCGSAGGGGKVKSSPVPEGASSSSRGGDGGSQADLRPSSVPATDRDTPSSTSASPAEESKHERDMLILRTIHGELTKLSQLNDKLVFAEDSVDRLCIALKQQHEQQPSHQQLAVSDEQLDSAREELALLREANNRSSREIDENRAVIAGLEEAFAEKKAKLKHLEYDVNVIEKEGRKLARELDKVLRIQISPDEEQSSCSSSGKHDESVDSCSTTAAAAALTAEDLEFSKRCLITGSPSSSGNSSDGKSTDGRGRTETPELPDLGDSFLLSSPEASPRGAAAVAAASGTLFKKPLLHSRAEAVKTARDPEAENSDTGLSSLHSSSDEATVDFGTLV